jgi:hypothetical protein
MDVYPEKTDSEWILKKKKLHLITNYFKIYNLSKYGTVWNLWIWHYISPKLKMTYYTKSENLISKCCGDTAIRTVNFGHGKMPYGELKVGDNRCSCWEGGILSVTLSGRS